MARLMRVDQDTTAAIMKAAVITDPQQVRVEEVAIPEPSPTQVCVRLEGCGICGSNLPVWEGRQWFQYPFGAGAPGHEGWGTIETIGEKVTDLDVDDRVAMLSYNAYAEYDVAEADQVVKLPDALDGEPFPGEPIGCAVNVFRRSNIDSDQTVAIVGIGFLGAILTSLASQAGARVIAISRRPFALEKAWEFGAAETVVMDDHWRVIEQVKELTNNEGCECVIEAVGLQWPLDLATELTRERGRLIIAGYHQDGIRQVNMQLWNWRGLDVINAHERDPKVYVEGIRLAADAVAKGELDPSPLYTHIFKLDKLADALETARNRPDGFLKALVMV